MLPEEHKNTHAKTWSVFVGRKRGLAAVCFKNRALDFSSSLPRNLASIRHQSSTREDSYLKPHPSTQITPPLKLKGESFDFFGLVMISRPYITYQDDDFTWNPVMSSLWMNSFTPKRSEGFKGWKHGIGPKDPWRWRWGFPFLFFGISQGKIRMEPENHLFVKETHLPNLHFWVLC